MKIYRTLILDIQTGETLFEDSYAYEGPLALCDRSLSKQGNQAITNANNTAGQLGSAANQISSNLIPGLEQEANNPTGYTPQQTNSQLVAGEQGAGGANAGITGQANLTAGRTRNAGGYGAALDQAARLKGQQLSQNALNVQNKSAELGQQKQQAAQSQLAGLYGTDTKGMLQAMGLVPQDIDATAKAEDVGWEQNLSQIGSMLGLGASGVGSIWQAANGKGKS